MPFAHNCLKQDSENILDLRLTGSQIILHSRSTSRPSSRTAIRERPMSATPTLFYQNKHRKTQPWMRPHSADHFSGGSTRKKLAAKFHESTDKKGKQFVQSGSRPLGETYNVDSISQLMESSSLDDLLDTESSVNPSPIPNDLSNAKLQPGLKSKPPIPPSLLNKGEQKSFDDIINIKFQRWFPESTHQPVSYSTTKDMHGEFEITSKLDDKSNFESGALLLQSEKPLKYQPDSTMPDSLGYMGFQNSEIKISSTDLLNNSTITESGKQNLSTENYMSSPTSLEDNLIIPSKSKNDTVRASTLDVETSHAIDQHDNKVNKLERTVDNLHKDTMKSNDLKLSSVCERYREPTKYELDRNEVLGSSVELSDIQDIKFSDPDKKEFHFDNKKNVDIKLDEKRGKKVTIVDSHDNKPVQTHLDRKITALMKNADTNGASSFGNSVIAQTRQENSEVIGTLLNDEQFTQFINPEQKVKSSIELNKTRVNEIQSSHMKFNNDSEEELKNKDIISWVESHDSVMTHGTQDKELGPGSTYEDILKMLKVLEKEEVETCEFTNKSVVKTDDKSTGQSRHNNYSSASTTPVGARDIITFLDESNEVQGNSNEQVHYELPKQIKSVCPSYPSNGRMATLLNSDSSELAKHVMSLSLELEERNLAYEKLNEHFQEFQQKANKQKKDSEAIIKRHQKFIDQLLSEKRVLGEQCAAVIKEMEVKHVNTLRLLEERHAIELKKQHDKMLAAEKIRREKWVDSNTKKIKELTVKGLEPELQRMTTVHQEELTDLRRAHERELSEMESACQRRLSTAREQALRDRESAVMEEREAARKKLEHEMSELERSYQDQRRRLLGEVRDEKEKLERESTATLAERNRQLEEKWQKAQKELHSQLTVMEEKNKAELKNMHEILERERKLWLDHQVAALSEKEKTIREQCKKERDRHIDMVIEKLESEATEKEKAAEKRFLKMKEQYEMEIKELETAENEIKRKLKDSRLENQNYEETISQLKIQISQLQGELSSMKKKCSRIEKDCEEAGNQVKNETASRIETLQKELQDTKIKQEEYLEKLRTEKQQELQQVYSRVIKAVSKKDDTIRSLQKQRDAALEQCTQLEHLLQQQRNDSSHTK